MCCDWCNVVYHPGCVTDLPADWQDTSTEWACPLCWQEAAEAADHAGVASVVALGGLGDGGLGDQAGHGAGAPVAGIGAGAADMRDEEDQNGTGAPARQGRRQRSKRQLVSRPRAGEDVRVRERSVQDRITGHRKQMNRSNRMETMYWVVPSGSGSYKVNNGKFLPVDQIDSELLKQYREWVGLDQREE